MFKSMLGFITGAILLYFSGDLINSSKYSLNYYTNFLLLFSSLCIFLLFYASLSNSRYIFNILIILLFIVIGFFYALVSAEKIKLSREAVSGVSQTALVKAYLCSLPNEGMYSKSADFCLIQVQFDDGTRFVNEGFKAKLRWPLDLDISKDVNLLRVKLHQPKSTVNFIGVSYETRLFYERVVLMGNVQGLVAQESVASLGGISFIRYYYHQSRKVLKRYSDNLLRPVFHRGIISALLMGDKSLLVSTDYKVLADTGTLHLIAISGLHVGLVIFGLAWLLPRTKSATLLVAILGLFYILLVGFSPSAQRAWVMCVCALMYFSGFLNLGKWKVFSFSLCLVLLMDPLATLNLGFWYSFLCVGTLFLLSQMLSFESRPWLMMIALQVFLLVGMIPISSLLGGKHGLENILANGLAIPWVSLLVLPLTLLWFVCSLFLEDIASYLLMALNSSLDLLIGYLSSLSIFDLPLSIDIHPATILAFSLCFVAFLIFNKIRIINSLSALGVLVAVIFPSKLENTGPELLVFDVGQGLAIAVRSGEHIWLYDTGPAYSKNSSSQKTILPYLRRYRKTSDLTGIIVSHGDADHAGDVASIFDYKEPLFAWSGQPDRLEVSHFSLCTAGMLWQAENIKIEILYPFKQTDLSRFSSNNHSCVMRLYLGSKVFLFMGDLESEAELELVSIYRDTLKADVLIAGHHGAVKSSSYALLKHVKPEHIVFSSGYQNKFGHPSSEVLARASQFPMNRYNTADMGAILWQIDQDKNEMHATSARNSKPNVWIIP